MREKTEKSILTEDQKTMVTLIGVRIARNAMAAIFGCLVHGAPETRALRAKGILEGLDDEIRGYEDLLRQKDPCSPRSGKKGETEKPDKAMGAAGEEKPSEGGVCCPYCGKSHYAVNYSTSTAMGWVREYRDGAPVAFADLNTHTDDCACLECGGHFSASRKAGKVTVEKIESPLPTSEIFGALPADAPKAPGEGSGK